MSCFRAAFQRLTASGPPNWASRDVREKCLVKLPVFQEILAQRDLPAENAAYMGDDLIDLPPMRAAGLSLAPADAVAEVRAMANWISDKPGGRGAVRQACEMILKSTGAWNQVTARYFENGKSQS